MEGFNYQNERMIITRLFVISQAAATLSCTGKHLRGSLRNDKKEFCCYFSCLHRRMKKTCS